MTETITPHELQTIMDKKKEAYHKERLEIKQ